MNNDPNDMGGEPWKEAAPSLSEAIFDLSTRLMKERAKEVEVRVKKLVGAGVPLYRIQLYEKPDCECHGSGVVIIPGEIEGFAQGNLRGYTCKSCLGILMTVDKRTPIS